MSLGPVSFSSLQSTFSAIVKQQRNSTTFTLEPEPEDKKDKTKKTEFEKALEEKQAEPIKAPEKPALPDSRTNKPAASDGKSGEGEFLEEFAQEIQNTAKKKPERRWKAGIEPGSEEDEKKDKAEDVFSMLGGVSGQRINGQRNSAQAMLAALTNPGGYQAAATAAAQSGAAASMAASGMASFGPAAFLRSLAAGSPHNSSTVNGSSGI